MDCKKELKEVKDKQAAAAVEEEKLSAEHKQRHDMLFDQLRRAVEEQSANAVLQDLVRQLEVNKVHHPENSSKMGLAARSDAPRSTS